MREGGLSGTYQDCPGVGKVRAGPVEALLSHRVGPGVEVVVAIAARLHYNYAAGPRDADGVEVRRVGLDREQSRTNLHLDQNNMGPWRRRHGGEQCIGNVQ